jgi:hypothetical protein
MHETATPEVKREKVLIPEEMTISEVQQKYSLNRATARNAKKKVSL